MNIEDADSTILFLLYFPCADRKTPRSEGLPTCPQSVFGSFFSSVPSKSRPEAVIDASTGRLKTTGIVFIAGLSAISGAVVGIFLREMCTHQLAFSLFPSWPVGAVGWRGGSHD